jgi:hypothetical protein
MQSIEHTTQNPNAESTSVDCTRKFIFIVQWWKDFPESEYGGTITTIASSDEECIKILTSFNRNASDEHLIPNKVKNAKKFELKDSTEKSRIVDSFTT